MNDIGGWEDTKGQRGGWRGLSESEPMGSEISVVEILYECNLWYRIVLWGGTLQINLQLTHQKRPQLSELLQTYVEEVPRQTLQELKILIVDNIFSLETVTYIRFKIPSLLTTQKHNYNNNQRLKLLHPIHYLILTEKNPVYTEAKVWNALQNWRTGRLQLELY